MRHSIRSLMLSLNDIIHSEVRKVYPGADAPDFDFTGSTRDHLVMSYRSRRQLCSFADGLVRGTARHFHEAVLVLHLQCAKRGDELLRAISERLLTSVRRSDTWRDWAGTSSRS